MSFDILPTPGLITDEEHPSKPDGTAAVDLRELVQLGYKWVSYQLVNGSSVNAKQIDIQKYGGASGFESCGCWGVVYDVADFRAFGERLGREAVRQDAEHVIVDAEECPKYTDDDRGCKPIIDGLRAGGWTGPVHLCPLGCPTNAVPHGPNDYHIDLDSFLETGGGVIPQAYYNAHANYRPDLCVDYWTAVGVPFERLNVMIELAFENTRIDGATWSGLLDDAGVGANFSAYMIQHGYDEDWQGLKPHSQAKPAPPDPEPMPPTNGGPMPPVTGDQCRDSVCTSAQAWEQNQSEYTPRARLTVCRRIAQTANDDSKWYPIRDSIVALLDSVELPK